MSSFIVSNECMNNIINGLFWTHEAKIWIRPILEKEGYINSEDFQRLGDDLYNLNARGTGQRYNDNGQLYTILKFNWIDNGKVNKWQVLKSIQCLSYQCCERDNNKQPLYKMLEKIETAWKNYCINQIKEYKEAKWD